MAISRSKTLESINDKAEDYEKHWRHYLENTHNVLLEKMHVNPDDVMLDLSCGTGFLARKIIAKENAFKKMVLNDISLQMQAVAKVRLGMRNDICFAADPAEKMSLPEHTFDKICSLSAFHNYENHQQVLEECYRLLKPGGKLFIIDWNNSGWFRPINWLIKQKTPENINTTSADTLAARLMNNGFLITHRREWRYRYWKLFYIIAEKRVR